MITIGTLDWLSFAMPILMLMSRRRYGHNTNQQGHFSTVSVNHWLQQYDANPPKVLIEDEANYEQLKYHLRHKSIPTGILD